ASALGLRQSEPQPGFRIAFLTDIHLRATPLAEGTIRDLIGRLNRLDPRPDFVIVGGDSIEAQNLLPGDASAAFDRLLELFAPLEMPVHWVLGNHDVVGWARKDGGTGYGKGVFSEKVLKGPTYRAFRHRDHEVILLDSIQPTVRPEGPAAYDSVIDDGQLQWLSDRLAEAGDRPILLATHSPLLTAYFLYNDGPYVQPRWRMVLENAKQVHELLKGKNVRLVLQGHTHVREAVEYAGRVHLTGGAVSGDWWNGRRFGIDPPGFNVIDVGSEIRHAYNSLAKDGG
ncbi:MAG: metallophosphoesterase, partial [Fimbriimonadaceae bacterium]|nr:metallophosphoesterase [Fimbriimonadaceae bacterium]